MGNKLTYTTDEIMTIVHGVAKKARDYTDSQTTYVEKSKSALKDQHYFEMMYEIQKILQDKENGVAEESK